MFFSPAIRTYSQENAGSHMARKPGSALQLRKPLVDRSVNENTPNTTERNLVKPNIYSKSKITLFVDDHEDLSCNDYVFSGREIEDNYEDILPKSERITEDIILSILRKFGNGRGENTPPPKKSISIARKYQIASEEVPFWLDEVPELPNTQFDNSFEEVPEPYMDDTDEFDMSF